MGKIMLYTYVKQNYNFTDDDRREALKTVDQILESAETCRREGILGLEKYIDLYENPVMKKALAFIIDGVLTEEEFTEILDNYIIFGDYTSKEMLELLIIKEGTLAIMNGTNAYHILEKLTAFLGTGFIDEAENKYKKIQEDRISHFYQQLKDGKKWYPDGTNLLEQKLQDVNDRYMQELLREISVDDMILSINGSSAAITDKFLRNLTKTIANRIVESIVSGVNAQYYNKPENIVEAQKRILETCK